MVLNKQKGNMYGFVTHTWNPIKGECSHDCEYCYMKVWKQNPIRLDKKDLKTDLGEGNFIFIGSSTDVFAEDVPFAWIRDVLVKCHIDNKNKYLFQTKNTKRLYEFREWLPKNCVVCTTIESDINHKISKAPPIEIRLYWLKRMQKLNYKIMITIEPIMDFHEEFINILKDCNPDSVNIGADSKRHGLKEPSKEKVDILIHKLRKFTEVNLKDNLKRLQQEFA